MCRGELICVEGFEDYKEVILVTYIFLNNFLCVVL